jgi:hypothetical protein
MATMLRSTSNRNTRHETWCDKCDLVSKHDLSEDAWGWISAHLREHPTHVVMITTTTTTQSLVEVGA